MRSPVPCASTATRRAPSREQRRAGDQARCSIRARAGTDRRRSAPARTRRPPRRPCPLPSTTAPRLDRPHSADPRDETPDDTVPARTCRGCARRSRTPTGRPDRGPSCAAASSSSRRPSPPARRHRRQSEHGTRRPPDHAVRRLHLTHGRAARRAGSMPPMHHQRIGAKAARTSTARDAEEHGRANKIRPDELVEAERSRRSRFSNGVKQRAEHRPERADPDDAADRRGALAPSRRGRRRRSGSAVSPPGRSRTPPCRR